MVGNVLLWIGFSWLKAGYSYYLLWTLQWTNGFHEIGNFFTSWGNTYFFKKDCFKTISYKVKLSRYRHAGNKGERSYSSYSFLTSVLDESQWSASRPDHALAPGKGPSVPIVQEAGWAPELVWTQARWKIVCLCRGWSPGCPAKSVVRHYTDWATLTPGVKLYTKIFLKTLKKNVNILRYLSLQAKFVAYVNRCTATC
jgi:hypothetical protein